MKIQHLRISNILGITSLEITPGGALTEISGDNGIGKTSVLEAIKAATQGGHDATLLRAGCDKGEVVLVMDDGTQLHKTISATRSTLDLIKDGKKIPRPSDTIKGLTDLLSVNPVDFLTAPKKDRVKVLLEAMPITVDAARLSEMAHFPVSAQEGLHGLALLEMVRNQVYEDRTGTNRAIKEKEATINQLNIAMPEVPGGVEGSEDELQQALEQARATRDAETARIDAKLTSVRRDSAEKVQARKAGMHAEIDALQKETQEAIDMLRANQARLLGIINTDGQAAIDAEKTALADTESKAGRVRQKALDAFVATAEPINTTLSAIRANRTALAKREQTKETILQMETELGDLNADAERQTASLDSIDAYKSVLLNSLPIPGLEVKAGEVFRHGLAFDRLNTAQQVEIAIEIAKLRAGDLAICCVDRFECLSPATFEEFKKHAETSGLQLFITRVEPGALTIRTN
jgi:DNA repair exonuclease SbcCD ATPase subunit